MGVAVIDTPNAFIQTQTKNKNKISAIKVRGVLVDLLLKIDPNFYGPFVTTEKRVKKVIVLQCLNAIYGKMVASLIYYKKFLKALKRTVFKLNPYDSLC